MSPVDASPEALREAALALRQARAQRKPIAPTAITYGVVGLDAAYAVAELNTRARLAEGRRAPRRVLAGTHDGRARRRAQGG